MWNNHFLYLGSSILDNKAMVRLQPLPMGQLPTGQKTEGPTTQRRMWGGGKRGVTNGSSSSGSASAGNSRPQIHLWLPEGFVDKVLNATAAESDVEVREGIGQNCISTLQDQTSLRDPINVRENWRIEGDDSIVPQRMYQFEITLEHGINPDRLRWILERLGAELNLVDPTETTENAAVLLSLPPYCHGCDSYGHTQQQCRFFDGQAGWGRTEPGVAPHASHAHGTYALRKLGLNRQFERVIRINDKQWVVKKASGNHNNCLIDTMRQSLQRPDGIADYPGYLDLARRDLAIKFPRGPYRVRTDGHPEGANYLEFLQHVVPSCRVSFSMLQN